ncbi:hypothetical protein UUU_33870 [Klebsiella pneumoniae subsp. pneumoniae DSM 30104 = JCM 1662 = NBRC 14940]|nr:hypothetical protein UUU_33870 [Klebsiella pneumoniae subsp. pneumoniae DSM 30104 = JCM 1662 = NBRC 14940]
MPLHILLQPVINAVPDITTTIKTRPRHSDYPTGCAVQNERS